MTYVDLFGIEGCGKKVLDCTAAATAFYSKKAMQENKRKIGKGILDDMEGKYTFDETVRLLEIICRD